MPAVIVACTSSPALKPTSASNTIAIWLPLAVTAWGGASSRPDCEAWTANVWSLTLARVTDWSKVAEICVSSATATLPAAGSNVRTVGEVSASRSSSSSQVGRWKRSGLARSRWAARLPCRRVNRSCLLSVIMATTAGPPRPRPSRPWPGRNRTSTDPARRCRPESPRSSARWRTRRPAGRPPRKPHRLHRCRPAAPGTAVRARRTLCQRPRMRA